jgi:hypothetical protein
VWHIAVELAEAERTLADRLAEALRAYVAYHGPSHDDECAGDDTCRCSCKPRHDMVNSALAAHAQRRSS